MPVQKDQSRTCMNKDLVGAGTGGGRLEHKGFDVHSLSLSFFPSSGELPQRNFTESHDFHKALSSMSDYQNWCSR